MQLRDVIFYTKNIKAAKEFYLNLGFELDFENEIFIAFKTGTPGIRLSLNFANNETKVPGHQVCSFNVKNIQEQYQNHKEKGLNIVKELTPFGQGFTYEIRDHDGNKLIFFEE